MLPGFILWGGSALIIRYMVEKERQRRFKLVKTNPQLCNNVVGGYKIFYGGVIYPVILFLTSIGAYYLMNKY